MTATALTAAPGARLTEALEDDELVAAVRRGDDVAFEQLYARYHRRIAAYVGRAVRDAGRTEDVVQDVFVAALKRMRATDAPIAFRPWVYEIAKNACIDHFRRAARTDEVSFDAQPAIVRGRPAGAESLEPEAAVDQKQRLADLRGAFGGLSATHHRILVMRELEGLSYEEIAARLGMTRSGVESTLFRARRRLGEEYEELVTGARCAQVRATADGAALGRVGARDRRKLAKHVAHCQPCRRHLRDAGLGELVAGRRAAGARLAALVPVPAFVRRAAADGEADAVAPFASAGTQVAPWTTQLSLLLDPAFVGWMKAVAAAAVVATGAGAGTAAIGLHRSGDDPVRPAATVSDALADVDRGPAAAGGEIAGPAAEVVRTLTLPPASAAPEQAPPDAAADVQTVAGARGERAGDEGVARPPETPATRVPGPIAGVIHELPQVLGVRPRPRPAPRPAGAPPRPVLAGGVRDVVRDVVDETPLADVLPLRRPGTRPVAGLVAGAAGATTDGVRDAVDRLGLR